MKPILPALLTILSAAVALRAAQPPEAPMRLPRYQVAGERVGRLEVTVPRTDLRPVEPNLGQGLLAIPGVYGHARAVDAVEPSIRGFGLDRVVTTLNGIPLVNASPERTNSPVVMFGPAAVSNITVTKSLPSVTAGPVTTGGHIALDSDEQAARPREGHLTTGRITAMYHGGREGVSTQGRLTAASAGWDATATFFNNDLGDYTAADGRRVAAELVDHGASAGLGWQTDTHRIRFGFLHRRLEHQEALSLPLDGKNTDSTAVTLSDRWSPENSGSLLNVSWRAGYSYSDPYITSEDRRVPALVFAHGTARSFGTSLGSSWRAGGTGTVEIGGDYTRQQRRAVRTTAVGKDYIWPDAVYADAGVFAEWKQRLSESWRLRLGARVDDVRSDARDVDQPAMGRPIREQFVTYNGPAAAKVDLHEVVGATNVLLEWSRGSALSGFVGAGISQQPAPVTERYRALLNALGGDGRGGNAVELGNPALRSERKSALEAGGMWRGGFIDLEATAYVYRVDNYILRTPVGMTRPPLPAMVVFGYRNIDAEFLGAEVGATARPSEAWSLPLTFAVADGRNSRSGVGLPEIPPWEASFALRYHDLVQTARVTAELGTRVVGARSNPAPFDNPLFKSTGGFSVWHARAGVPLRRWLRVDVGVENLLDRRYTEYLSPPVGPFRPASGDLLPGDRVPAPGRSAWMSVTASW